MVQNHWYSGYDYLYELSKEIPIFLPSWCQIDLQRMNNNTPIQTAGRRYVHMNGSF
jgi:hypothetical protein